MAMVMITDRQVQHDPCADVGVDTSRNAVVEQKADGGGHGDEERKCHDGGVVGCKCWICH
jgi:hypothetical protein